jgi:hypothetical protein
MKSVFKQVVAALVAIRALSAAMGEAMEFQAEQTRGTRPRGGVPSEPPIAPIADAAAIRDLKNKAETLSGEEDRMDIMYYRKIAEIMLRDGADYETRSVAARVLTMKTPRRRDKRRAKAWMYDWIDKLEKRPAANGTTTPQHDGEARVSL